MSQPDDPAAQAARWAKEHPHAMQDGEFRVPTYESDQRARHAYLAGHAAGEVAGAERERARVLAIIEDVGSRRWDSRSEMVGVIVSLIGHPELRLNEDGEFCGGRIEVEP